MYLFSILRSKAIVLQPAQTTRHRACLGRERGVMQRRERGPKDVARAGGRDLETSRVGLWCQYLLYIYKPYTLSIYYNMYSMYILVGM